MTIFQQYTTNKCEINRNKTIMDAKLSKLNSVHHSFQKPKQVTWKIRFPRF